MPGWRACAADGSVAGCRAEFRRAENHFDSFSGEQKEGRDEQEKLVCERDAEEIEREEIGGETDCEQGLFVQGIEVGGFVEKCQVKEAQADEPGEARQPC